MASFWRRLFGQESRGLRFIEHPRLGPIEFDDAESGWSARVTIDGKAIRFLIGGNRLPDQGLVLHAVSILDDFGGFRAKVRALLEAEAAARPRLANEIKQLQILDVCLWWPDRREVGMIYFSGPDRFRVWRCDYGGGALTSLGFDS